MQPQYVHPLERVQHRGRAALQRRVRRPQSTRALALVVVVRPHHNPPRGTDCPPQSPPPISPRPAQRKSLSSPLWKIRPHPRICPVIAGDTTYCVYSLTGTTDGSNFAFPSMKFRLTGMRRDVKKSAEAVKRTLAKPEVTRPPSQLKPRSLGRAAFHPKAAAQRSQSRKQEARRVGWLSRRSPKAEA
jgi:hypothetical protein